MSYFVEMFSFLGIFDVLSYYQFIRWIKKAANTVAAQDENILYC